LIGEARGDDKSASPSVFIIVSLLQRAVFAGAAEFVQRGLGEAGDGGVDGGDDFIGGLAGAGAGGGDDGVALVGVHESGGFEDLVLVLAGDGEEAVLVGVDERAGVD